MTGRNVLAVPPELPAERVRPVANREETATGTARPIAIVGAGISGLVCAQALAEHGHRVQVLEKSRGPGGRMATRRHGDQRFDHGAQYFTVRDPRFARRVASWRADGVVEPWRGRIVVLDRGKLTPEQPGPERLVGAPGMNAICRRLAADLDVVWRSRVAGLERHGSGWRLRRDDGTDLGCYDAVVVSAPAPQTADLVAEASPRVAGRARSVEMAPCWAVMVTFDGGLDLELDGAFVGSSPLSWVSRNGSKPGRPRNESWVLHAGPDWSLKHLDLEADAIAERLIGEFSAAVGVRLPGVLHLDAHRWRYALPAVTLQERCVVDRDARIVACGDWCGGPRVEGAFLSGTAAAERVLDLAGTYP